MSLADHFVGAKHVAVAIDASGGFDAAMYDKYIAELNEACRSISGIRLDVWFFDTQVRNSVTFVNPKASDLDQLTPSGFGGTIFLCNWKHMETNKIKPDLFVIFSDGYVMQDGFEKYGDYCPTVFVIHKGNWKSAPFGALVEI